MSEDNLNVILYGKTEKVKLADGKEYILREPDIDTLEELNLNSANINDMKTIKQIAWCLLSQPGDNPSIKKDTFGRLLTLSMMTEGSEFMSKVLSVLGRTETKKE